LEVYIFKSATISTSGTFYIKPYQILILALTSNIKALPR